MSGSAGGHTEKDPRPRGHLAVWPTLLEEFSERADTDNKPRRR